MPQHYCAALCAYCYLHYRRKLILVEICFVFTASIYHRTRYTPDRALKMMLQFLCFDLKKASRYSGYSNSDNGETSKVQQSAVL